MSTGTHDISTLLAARDQSVAAFGLNNIVPILESELAAHNAIAMDMVSTFAEPTTDRQRKYGTSAASEMIEADEYSRAPTQRSKPGSTVGFPLKMYQFALGWTRKWFDTKTPADLAIAVQSAERAHLRRLQNEIKKGLMLSGNYTFTDFLVDNVDLAVKRLVNADSAAIPEGPNNEVFDGSTHTHYLARAGGALAASDLKSAINTVVEHGHGAMVKAAISKTDETTVRALSGFTAFPDPRIVYRNTDTPGQTLDISRLDNRAIGIFEGAEVWVKPWAIANYILVWDDGSPKPLAMRQRDNTAMQGLRIAGENDAFPLHAQYMEAEFGFGAWNRTNGAVLYFGNTTYADPTIS
jgi:hypothetical protein